MGVSANDDWVSPSWNKLGYVLTDNGLTEDSSAENVTDGSIGRPPHLFEVELCYTSLVRCNGCTFNSDFAFLDCICSVDGDLIVSGITVLDGKIEVLDRDLDEGEDELVFDHLPDDPGHLISVHLGD